MQVENKGNLVTRRAFAERDGVDLHRIKILARVTNKALSMAYQMTEEVGLYGSGRRSHLYVLCELVRELFEIEQREGGEVSAALEMARYPLSFLQQLRGDVPDEGDAIHKLNFLLKSASDANYQLKGRDLKDLTPGELRDFEQKLLNVMTLAHELSIMVDAQIGAAEYPGAPIMRERKVG
ncbi:MAG TPA: hypothetical protein VN256_12945 [Pyrinomonadaceae bacterium]|nr:hypothetical protein [Pyrinomonadaceae bacterium]